MKTKLTLIARSKFLMAVLLSFGALAASAAEVVLVPAGIDVPGGSTGWRYRLGTSEASAPIPAWRTNNFVENATWNNGALPLGYVTGTPNDPNGYEGKLVTATVPAGTLSVFLRKTFVITNRAAFSAIRLGVMVDDGMVAWVNGQEVMRFQCCAGGTNPDVPSFNSAANSALESATNSSLQVADISGPLIDGTNVLAIQLFNANATSSDLVLDATLVATIDDQPPVIVSRTPVASSTVQQLNSVEVVFSEAVGGIDSADLLINGAQATNVIVASPTTFTWVFAQPPTGTVNVAFAPAHGISDLAEPSNNFAGSAWTYTLNTNIILPQFFITEFMADNSGDGLNAIRDEDGDGSDWIEIYNSDQSVGNIGGWFLTDATNNLAKWRIPNGTTIPGRGYLVVFASGKNRTNVAGRLHTNFQLNNDGEYLALLNPLTNIVSQFSPTYPSQQEDVSYGRDRVNLDLIGYYTVPTPGSNNVTSGVGFGPEVHFSYTNGTFITPFNLTLSVDDSNSVIRYTIVNTAQNVGNATNIPTPTSTLYTGPIQVNGTMQVRARAFPNTPGFFPGPPRTESYIQLAGGTTTFTSDLPIVVIHTMGPGAISGGFPSLDNSVIIQCFDNDGGTASLNKPPQLVTRAGINLRGSSTQGYPKSSWAVELWDEFNNDVEKSFLGLPQESDWVLYAPNAFDLSLMHNPIMHKFARDMGYYSSRTRFVEVFYRNDTGALTADTNATAAAMGNYQGVYVLEEKIKRDGNRVDIDRLEPEHTNATTITGGWLLKIDRDDPNERVFNPAGVNDNINYQDPDGLEMVAPPPVHPGRAMQAAYILSYFNNFNAGLAGTSLTNVASTNHYSNYLDVDATIDHHIVNVATMNVDGYRLSGYIHKPRGGKLIFGPVWDVDRGLGTSRGDLRAFNPRAWQAWDPLGASDYGTDFFQGATPPGFMRLWFTDVDFWQRWVDRYQHWRTSVLDTNRVAAMVDGFHAELRQAQVREQRRWGGNGASDTNPRTGVVNAGGGVYSHTFPGTFQGEVDFQKKWLIEHIHFMDTNLLNRPSLPTPEGQIPMGTLVAITDNSGKVGTKIYYTVDGSDPRGFQGTTNPAALLYNGPITLTNNVRIRARAVNANHRNLTGVSGPGSRNPVVSTPWSGDIVSTYYLTPPRLVVTELMYHPAPPTSQSDTNDADNFEFIELKNVGTTVLNLTGFRFTNGIDFTFSAASGVTTLAPGASVLVVKHLAAFTSRYGAQPNIAGVYNGSLANEGERITLVGPALEPVLDFTYSDNWLPVTDGFGWSLVIKDPTASPGAWDVASSWRASASAGGSPGVDDPAPPPFAQVLINEALTHTDFPVLDQIELFNAGTADVNVGGWFLTDDPTADIKYVIPAATVIPAGGFLVLDESQFTNGPTGFSLSSEGDELYVFSAAAGEPTGYSHGFEFGAAQNGVTFGRYVNSQGHEHFVAQQVNTLGANNSLPRVGPVVISEAMYHPPDVFAGGSINDNSIDEFIELHNLASTNVALYDASHPSNTWRLTSGVDFDFPTNTSISANSSILVVNFNPTNSIQLAAFRSKYGVPVGVPIFGPYGGQLDNSGESIRLRRPDSPNTNGAVPYILVDQVDYLDEAPWSKFADGAGASLQRIVVSAYGNDPTNWVAAAPSASALFQGGALPSIAQQPADATAFVGFATNFSVAVSGAGARVQWRLNGTPIPGATNATLTLGSVQYQHSGFYDAVVYNSGGAIVSGSAFLSVLTPLTFSLQPVSQFVQSGANVTLTSAAFGSGEVRYQWRFEGGDIPDATNANYSFANAQLDEHHGNYSVRVFDDFGFLDSTNAFIYLMVRPAFTVQPTPVTVVQGGTAVFSVMATGAPPLFYRWIRNGVGIQTSTVPILVLTNVQIGNPNPVPIRAAVTNFASGAGGVNSLTVQLIVHADADGDSVGDPWELQYGFSTNNTADGALDFDGDGASNQEEYVAGTNPTNSLSVLKIALSTTESQVLEFVAQSNISYTMQYRTNLVTAPWTSLTNVLGLINTVRTVQVTATNPPPNPEIYYRVVTPLVP